jgi:hypothetical protein
MVTVLAMAIAAGSTLYSTRFLIVMLAIMITSMIMIMLITNKEKTLLALGMLTVVSLLIVPKVSLGGVNLRFEDYLTVFFGIFTFGYITNKSEEKPPILKWIIAYLVYSLLISLTQILLNDLSLIYLFYLLKEIQYFLYFVVFFYLSYRSENNSRSILRVVYVCSGATLAWGVIQMLTTMRGYYGIGLISETASSQSGTIFFLITMFYMYRLNAVTKYRMLHLALVFLSVALTLSTVSRTAIMGVVVCILLYAIITVITMRITTKKVIISIYSLAVGIPLAYMLIGSFFDHIIARLSQATDSADERQQHWGMYFSRTDTMGVIFGKGKGFMQTITGGFTLGADNMYVRQIIEIGYVGLSIWLLIILGILRFCLANWKKFYPESLFILLATLGFLIMGSTHEVFIVTLQASFYWILIGWTMGKVIREKKLSL